MKPLKKAVANIGKYTDKNGQEKNQYLTVGKLMQRPDGSMCLKLDAIPVNFNGWLSFYDLDENRQAQNEQGMAQAKAAAAPNPHHHVANTDPFEDTEIPF